MTDRTDAEKTQGGRDRSALANLKAPKGANRPPKRVGRGKGSGHGGTSTYGHKGQKARKSPDRPRGFEGGQMPLQRRIPKRGFWSRSRKTYAILNLPALDAFEAGSLVDADALVQKGIVRRSLDGIKVLGNGEITKPLTLRVAKISASARVKVEKAGGQVILEAERAAEPAAQMTSSGPSVGQE